MEKNKYFDTILENFQALTQEPDYFLNADNVISNKVKANLKDTYDFAKSQEKKIKSDALPELIIKKFDLEQIWQQIELQNDTLLTRSIANVSKLIVGKHDLLFSNLEQMVSSANNDDEKEINLNRGEDGNIEEENNSDSEEEIDELDLNDQNSDRESSDNERPELGTEVKKKSVVDDEFFKLEEMEKFLNVEEKKIQDQKLENKSEESDSEEEHSIDLFEGDSDDEDEKEKTVRFKDFFVAKDDKKPKRNKFLNNMSDGEEETLDRNHEAKSSLELRQERLKKKIDVLEKTAVSEKPWQLKGEITAGDRPPNSLLEEIVEFDLTSKPAPVITEQTTLQLEDIIKQRIKDRTFDSVVRKMKPVETPIEYKKKLVLDQEKSKQSLAQIYEKEFLEKQTSLDPENNDKEEVEPELHKEVKTLMRNLFNKLDALSNFHFTPKMAIPELKIINNLPAISMEEVAPVAASDAALLAPEEVKNKVKGDIMGKAERTATDKNRERRKKKLKQRAHLKEKQKRENLVNKLNPGLGNKYSKEKAKKLLQQVTKDKNVEKMDESIGSKNVKSSKAFFAQLQEEVQTHINNKVKSKKTKRNKEQIEAKKIKL